ncbi:AraC family transcriptional regulator [Streptomyces sp. NPDC007851]|uniref:AraC family transcriptional regulator n=1 Tax=Streptomyces sp. NPDC007851 TaxID=3155008 RepID=UPI0033DC46D9
MDWDSEFTFQTPLGSVHRPVSALADDALGHMPNEITDTDFGHFRDVLNSHYYPARVEPLDRTPHPRAPRLAAVHLSYVTIGYVRFGASASVDPGDLTGYHVNVPLQGRVASQCGTQSTTASPSTAAVFSPHRHTYLPRWEADAAQLCIKFDRLQVEKELASLLGHPVTRPIEFRLDFPLDHSEGKRWVALLSGLLSFLDGGHARTPAAVRHIETLERSLISGLLLSQPHSYSEVLWTEPAQGALPRALNDVIDVIETSPEREYVLSDLADRAGLSLRGLQYTFQRHLGMSPMQYLRGVRLDRAREDLQAGVGTVSDIAYQWGFTNLGRFARAYRERFGELPSDTLGPGLTPSAPRRTGPHSWSD